MVVIKLLEVVNFGWHQLLYSLLTYRIHDGLLLKANQSICVVSAGIVDLELGHVGSFIFVYLLHLFVYVTFGVHGPARFSVEGVGLGPSNLV